MIEHMILVSKRWPKPMRILKFLIIIFSIYVSFMALLIIIGVVSNADPLQK